MFSSLSKDYHYSYFYNSLLIIYFTTLSTYSMCYYVMFWCEKILWNFVFCVKWFCQMCLPKHVYMPGVQVQQRYYRHKNVITCTIWYKWQALCDVCHKGNGSKYECMWWWQVTRKQYIPDELYYIHILKSCEMCCWIRMFIKLIRAIAKLW